MHDLPTDAEVSAGERPLDVDIIRNRDRIRLLDKNPRFGGHHSFAHLAGADIPAARIAWAQGSEANPDWLRVRHGVEGDKEIVAAHDHLQ